MLAILDGFDRLLHGWMASQGHSAEFIFRLILAMLAGGLVGLEREIRGREAGFRTNVLVCVGSCLVMLVSINFALADWPHAGNINLNLDPARIAYSVMTGVGFLGAGAIVHSKGSVRGLTTAAGLWCVAAVGLACGFGLYLLACVTTVLVLSVLWLFGYVEAWIPRPRYRTITVQHKWEPGCVDAAIKRFEAANFRVVDASFDRSDDLNRAIIHLSIGFTNKHQYYTFERQLESDTEYQLLSTREI